MKLLIVHCVFFSFFIAFSTSPLLAQQQIQFDHYSLNQGFYDGIVTCFFQDKYKYLWVGTADGLYRFDGYQFIEYRKNTDDPNGLKSNVITAIEEDQSGHLWIGTEGAGLSLFNRQDNKFFHFVHDIRVPNSLSSNFVTTILSDTKGNLWLGTEDKGLNLLQFDEFNERFYFRHVQKNTQVANALSSNKINTLFEDSKGRIWIGTTNRGLIQMNYDSLSDLHFKRYRTIASDTTALSSSRINVIFEDEKGYIWIGGNKGLGRLDPLTDDVINFFHNPDDPFSLSSNKVYSIEPDEKGKLWIGTRNGLNLLDINTGRCLRYFNNLEDPNSISSNYVMDIIKDDQNNLWVGTWGGALNRINPLARQITHFPHIPGDLNSLSHPLVRSIAEDHAGRLWMATPRGIDCFDPKTQAYKHYLYEETDSTTLAFSQIYSIFADHADNIWIGTSNGAFRFNPFTEKITSYRHKSDDPFSITRGEVREIFEDSYGLIWVGVYGGGLDCLDPKTEQFTHYHNNPFNPNSLGGNRIMEIYEDKNKDLWIGTYEGGLTHIVRDDLGRVLSFVRHRKFSTKTSKTISSDVVWSILEGPDSLLWIGTANGLNVFDRSAGTFKSYKEEDGLINNFVFGLLQGTDNLIWLSTNRGLSLFNPATEEFQNFDSRDGLQQNEFNVDGFWKGRKNGALYFGGVNGMIMLPEAGFQPNQHLPNVIINKMLVFETNKDLTNGEEDYSIAFKDAVSLPYYMNTLEFEFLVLNFINPQKNKYSYRLKGLSDNWIDLGNNNTIRFGGLNPGKYFLEVKGANNDGIWTEKEKSLQITIKAPWWLTLPAKFFYSLLFLLILYGIYRFFLGKRLAEKESERLREQDAFKSKLYTNITHEFRTPLTVISGMTELIEGNSQAKSLIKRNAQNLLNLVNQMLELRKLESGNISINNIQADIVNFTKYTLEPFYALAEKKGVKINVINNTKEIWMDFDPEIMHRILSNLISNAIKYNKTGGEVYIQLECTGTSGNYKLLLFVRDTGIGIRRGHLEHIFKRFYQIRSDEPSIEKGTGVGLALVKEYINALNGEIRAESRLGEGSVFKITLPIHRVADLSTHLYDLQQKDPDIETIPEVPVEAPKASMNPDLDRILIVEDNPDVIQYLNSCLKSSYNIIIEKNGKAALKRAYEEIPDLIISDVMMPQKNGYQLVEELKKDVRTSHIPVILLTAKADTQSKLKGLHTGADAYLTKPFNRQELLLRIAKLLELREMLRLRYQSGEITDNTKEENFKREDEFILKVQDCILANIKDPDFGVQDLCKEMGLSRTQLHNKMKALTNKSTSIFIRSVRLKEARKRLTKGTNKTISEIAFEVGFKDPNYFTRTFNQEYGVSPSQIKK